MCVCNISTKTEKYIYNNSCIRKIHLKTDTIPQMFVKVSLICPHIPLK